MEDIECLFNGSRFQINFNLKIMPDDEGIERRIYQFMAFPLLIWGAVAIFGGVMSYFIYKWLTTIEGKSLVVLGPKMSGKTTFYRILQGKGVATSYESTREEIVEEFEYIRNNGEKVKIKKGVDRGGGEDFIPSYAKEIEDCDCMIFIFDLKEYDRDLTYARNVRARLDWCDKHINTISSKKNTCVLMSHLDSFTEKEGKNAVERFLKSIEGKGYAPMVKRNCAPLNLTDVEKVKNAVEKIFN